MYIHICLYVIGYMTPGHPCPARTNSLDSRARQGLCSHSGHENAVQGGPGAHKGAANKGPAHKCPGGPQGSCQQGPRPEGPGPQSPGGATRTQAQALKGPRGAVKRLGPRALKGPGGHPSTPPRGLICLHPPFRLKSGHFILV